MTDSHSCHTYEDQATQTEDEDDNDPDLRDVALLPYGENTSRFGEFYSSFDGNSLGTMSPDLKTFFTLTS